MKLKDHEPEFVTGLQHELGPTRGLIWKDAVELCRIARALSKCNERECNEPMSNGARVRFELRVERLEAEARAIAEKWGVPIEFNGDPRGFSIHLRLPSGRSNSFGGDGVWGV